MKTLTLKEIDERINPILLIIMGRSCTGKTTLVKSLKDDFHEALSFTTRAIRTGETNGADYNFISIERFNEMKNRGELFEYIEYNGNYYGLNADSFDFGRDNIVIVEPDGAKQLKQALSDRFNILTIQLEAPDHIILDRFKKRGDNPLIAEERFIKDKEIFKNTGADVIFNFPYEKEDIKRLIR
ncbi:MAG: guanylate kinase [Bacilli bacterium]|jgi:guanylate kinase|nr:guanylate kinase [Bacilli bacterium]